jgi:chromosome segregation ATPase
MRRWKLNKLSELQSARAYLRNRYRQLEEYAKWSKVNIQKYYALADKEELGGEVIFKQLNSFRTDLRKTKAKLKQLETAIKAVKKEIKRIVFSNIR